MLWRALPVVCAGFLFVGQPARAEAPEGSDIVLQNRHPLAFMLFAPSGDTGATRSAEIVRWVSELVDKHTDLRVERRDAEEAVECAGRLGCIAELVRTDYQRETYRQANGAYLPYAEVVKRLKEKKTNYPQYLMIISKVADDDVDRVTFTVLDTDAALEVLHDADRNNNNWRREAEAQIAKVAPIAPEKSVEVRSEDDARTFIEERFRTDLRRRFEDDGRWEPYGSVEISCSVVGAGIKLDGTTIGTTKAGVTKVLNVVEGKHQLTLEHPDYRTEERSIDVQRRSAAPISVTMSEQTASGSMARTVTFWGGVGAGAAGATILVVAIAMAAQNDVTTYCPQTTDGGSCGGSQFITHKYRPSEAPTFDDVVNPSGILLAPLGYSVFTMGATWALGTLLFGEEGEFPWIQLAAGVVLGGAAYGLSAALNGSSPFEQ